MSDAELVVRADGVSKKFCRDLRRSLWYGAKDLAGELVGHRRNTDTLRRDEFWAVEDVSFELRRGECLGLIGHNGAGKTTLLRLLNGLITPDRGQIAMRGRVGALIALGAGFNPVLSGRENIYVNAAVLGFSKKETTRRFDEIVGFSGLGEFIDAPVQQYSSGMYVRLGFSIAAHLEPDVLLVDEALAVGDISFVFKCLNRIAELRRSGTAVIFVTHNEVQLREAAQRCLLLDHGRLVEDSTVEGALLAQRNLLPPIDGTGDAGYVHPGRIVIRECSREPDPPRTGQPLRITLELSVAARVPRSTFELRFWSSTGQLMTSISTSEGECEFDHDTGAARIVIDIPHLPLPAGSYRLAGGFRSDGEVIGWSRDLDHIRVERPNEPWIGTGVVPMQATVRMERG